MSNILTAAKYYIQSIPTLVLKTNFISIPKVLFLDKVVINAGGLKLFVRDLMDVWTIKEVVLDGQYELFRQIRKNDTVIDIGGGVGDFGIKASLKADRVFSYEIDSNRLSLFRQNLSLNQSKNVKIIKKKIKSLDQVFKENKLERCDFFKIDCEGCEYNIFLNSSSNALRKIEHIAAEIHLFDDQMRQSYTQLKEMLKENSFDIKEIDNPVHSYIKYFYATNKKL